MNPVSAESLLLVPDLIQRFDFALIFGDDRPVELELGCGDGSFLLEWSALNPTRNFLGVERLKGRMQKLDKKGRRRGLTNLRGLRLEATYVLEWLVPAASLAALHVYFPDPWPKARHHKRRLVQAPFAAQAARALRPGGVLHLRTDHAEYFSVLLPRLRKTLQVEEHPAPWPDAPRGRTVWPRPSPARPPRRRRQAASR